MAGRSDLVTRKFSVLCVCFTLFNLTLLVALCAFNICSGDEVFSLSDDRWGGAKLMMGERTWKHGGGVGRRKNRTIQENKSEKFQFVLPRYSVSFIVVSVRPNQTQRRGEDDFIYYSY